MQADQMRREAVNHPAHYGGADNPFEVIKVLEAWLTPEEYAGFLKGNVIKYLARARAKNGAEDDAKAAWYAARLAEFEAKRAREVSAGARDVHSR